jgi:two-component system nitrogen regulation response regulator GlnG
MVSRLDVSQLVQLLLQNGEADIYERVCLEVDRVVLSEVLRHVKGSQVQASQLLGISRNTLRAKIGSLGMAIQKQVIPETSREE